MLNALSIDLEDWYHPECVKKHLPHARESMIRDSAGAILTLLDKYQTKATFFIVGEIAEEAPDLIRRIHRQGHEIAAHGFSHTRLSGLGRAGLTDELARFKQTITGTLGDIEIKGFRAPSFSLDQDTVWAVDILKKFGFRYDSSVFPMKINGYYGTNGVPLGVYRLGSGNITTPDPESRMLEFPISVCKLWGLTVPATGGFYLRVIPPWIQKKMLRAINRDRPCIVYIHPWECDRRTPRIALPLLPRFVTYYKTGSALRNVEYLLKHFSFGRIDTVLGV